LPVTVTEVRVSPDLRNATVFVVTLGGIGDRKTLIEALGAATPFLRHRVAQSVALKYVPNLIFRFDVSFDQASRIDDLLRDPAVARDLTGKRDDELGDEES
jgi:ribosome-binding factor A